MPYSSVKISKITLTLATLVMLGCSDSPASPKPKSPPTANANQAPTYTVPDQYTLTARAERLGTGDIRILGNTNLPPATQIWIELKGGQTSKVWVGSSGDFSSEPFNAGGKPLSAGKQSVLFSSYFNSHWQTPEVRRFTGENGVKLKGKIFKETDPDVVDSPVVLDYRLLVNFPPLSEDALAISTVQSAVLTVSGRGRSSASVGETVKWFCSPGTGMSQRKGWSAEVKNGRLYHVMFDYNPASEGPAIWSVDLNTKQVRYVNRNAKYMSYLPSE